jgi:hypothetical protein
MLTDDATAAWNFSVADADRKINTNLKLISRHNKSSLRYSKSLILRKLPVVRMVTALAKINVVVDSGRTSGPAAQRALHR